MNIDTIKRAAWLAAAIITAPVWVPVYLYHVARQARDDIHD